MYVCIERPFCINVKAIITIKYHVHRTLLFIYRLYIGSTYFSCMALLHIMHILCDQLLHRFKTCKMFDIPIQLKKSHLKERWGRM